MRVLDTRGGYGWTSIFLHWLSAVLILGLWFVGRSLSSSGEEYASVLHTHTTLALSSWVLLVVRIAWRFRSGHPKPLPKQAGPAFLIGIIVHYVLLVAVAAMLVSGPVMLMARGASIPFFDLTIDSPFSASPPVADLAQRMHIWGGWIIFTGVIVHLAGVFKDVAFRRDGTLARMMIAASAAQEQAPSVGPPYNKISRRRN